MPFGGIAVGGRSRCSPTGAMQRRLGQLDLDLLASSDSLQIVHQDLRPLISLADVLRQRFHNDGLQVIRRGSDVAIQRHGIMLEDRGNNISC